MQNLFGIHWRQLDLQTLQAFLADVESEPLLWEAKGGGRLDPNEIRRQCGAFANSAEGGFLLLGVSEVDGRWQPDGIGFPENEAERYVTSCLAEGVRPRPVCDVHSISVGDERAVAVVRVEPLMAGPCIVRGTVFERVPGATVRVRDPLRLADLYARGRDAHANAIAAAERARRNACRPLPRARPDAHLGDVDAAQARYLYISIGIASVAGEEGCSEVVFRASTRERISERVKQLAHTGYPLRTEAVASVGQDRRSVAAITPRFFQSDWAMTVFSSGAVGVGYSGNHEYVRPEVVVDDVIAPGLKIAAETLHDLKRTGAVYVRLSMKHDDWPSKAVVERETEISRVGEVLLDLPSVQREISRTLGIDDPEPEPVALGG